jgi:hypothetical protein
MQHQVIECASLGATGAHRFEALHDLVALRLGDDPCTPHLSSASDLGAVYTQQLCP